MSDLTEQAAATDEWCTDCKEYDKKKHCCPRWNKVIRRTLAELQPQRMRGRWGEWHEKKLDSITVKTRDCSCCGSLVATKIITHGIGLLTLENKFCPLCGADMRETE